MSRTRTRTINFWLRDRKWVDANIKYENKDYLYGLFERVSIFTERCPVPLLLTYDTKKDRIFFRIGSEDSKFSGYLGVSDEIAHYDFVTLLYRKVYPAFISYNVSGEIGTIVEIYMKKDEFNLEINGNKIKYFSTIPLQKFLKQLRNIRDESKNGVEKNESVRNFILENSKESHIQIKNKSIALNPEDYKGEILYNFFKINFIDIKETPIKVNKPEGFNKFEENLWKWGRFRFRFDTEENEKRCLNYVRKRLNLKG